MKNITALISSLMLGLFLFAPSAYAAEEKARSEGQETYTLYKFKASSKAIVEQLDKRMRGDSRFKDQGCESISKKSPRYVCKKNDATTQALFATGVSNDAILDTRTAACPAGCGFMRCPPPTGPYKCCNQTTYQPCP